MTQLQAVLMVFEIYAVQHVIGGNEFKYQVLSFENQGDVFFHCNRVTINTPCDRILIYLIKSKTISVHNSLNSFCTSLYW